ncbi:uncharacterized protein LOC124305033 [Neodiprion virginianus]|uniref:uncharacterized protein LOC124305033 n=1 Tax=Neodiprion virginianus TaxID=2961670 RepID=UPI001EE77BB7|nr:uncharacterized protein LOC124305033 [Neodiprion virginianus]
MSYPLTPGDVDEVRHFWIRSVQQTYFAAELKILSKGSHHKSNPRANLTPGGRPTQAFTSAALSKTPPDLTKNVATNGSYWILGGQAPVRAHILRCVTCARLRGLQAQQLMGQLPPARVTPSQAFLYSGLDYAGPFTIKTWRGRAAKTYKGYFAVFVCFATSAVYFELVTDYTSEAFIAAYRRFSGRRGICHTLYSDCGTNFIGADAELELSSKLAQQK